MKLKPEEKFAFLHLSQFIAKLDGEYSLNEREIIEEYCLEMGIENMDLNQEHFVLEANLEIFSTSQSKRIVMLALMVLVHIDDKFGLYEHKIIDKIASTFDIVPSQLHLFSMWGKATSALYEQALVFTEA